MDDLQEKLAGILNDPESMEQVRKMAENLLGTPDEPTGSGEPGDSFSPPDGEEMQKIMRLLSKFHETGNDNRSALLLALRPMVSEPKREKIDTAIKILRMIDLLPYLKESGILNF